jgi:hypothetical protein
MTLKQNFTVACCEDASSVTTIIFVFLRLGLLGRRMRRRICQNLTLALPQEFADFRKLRTVFSSCGPTPTYQC